MCGRFLSVSSNDELGGMFGTTIIGDPLPVPSLHIHPTDDVRVVLESKKEPGRRLEGARWDLARPGQKTLRHGGPPLINLRTETAQQKFAWALKSNRCLFPATGYWEWTGKPSSKQPYYFHDGDGVLAFAGVYSWWKDPSKADDDPTRWALTAALFTTDAAPHLAEVHDRNPLMLPKEFWADWLDPQTPGDQSLVDAAVQSGRSVAQRVKFYPVAPFRGDADGPELIDPLH